MKLITRFLFIFTWTILCVSIVEVLCENQKDIVKDIIKGKHDDKSSEHEKESSNEGSMFHALRKKSGNLGFLHAFLASLSVILVSEIGDKTFFIAAIMAMRHSRTIVFAGAISSLWLMTILSAIMGYATTIIPRWFTYYASSALFAVFGLKMIKEGYEMSPDEGQEEMDEVQADIKKQEEEYEKERLGTQDIETGVIRTPGRKWFHALVGTVFLQSFTLNFLAEWGDRSQIATIVLGARENIAGVIIGGCIGHFICTGIAVLGGRMVAQKISVRTVTLIGGVVFLIFALSAFFVMPE
ncbi:putative divalent cation/proton antiporter TMEM165 [Mytilus trossulus]|uniref:putative divalent cation/proton antiporter TMEM165 n=1 Tax=Mytilus trossulus TaxID=6551 RepID=UPI003005A979